MIAEDLLKSLERKLPEISTDSGKTMSFILQSLKDACAPFKTASKQPNLIPPLNENKLTQIFVEQVEVKIKNHPTIGVKNQYSDLFNGTRGIPDFYFHIVEEGVCHEALFVVESKRLPSPSFEKEYVIGENKNGGIERFKIEKHGKGFNQCGLIGFIEVNTPKHWLNSINSWILELSATEKHWSEDEKLNTIEILPDYSYLKSISKKVTSENVLLHHFWIDLV